VAGGLQAARAASRSSSAKTRSCIRRASKGRCRTFTSTGSSTFNPRSTRRAIGRRLYDDGFGSESA